MMIRKLKSPRLKRPYLIACWPGMGEVSLKAGLFLKNALNFQEFARVEKSGLFEPIGIISQRGIAELPKIEEGTFYFSRQKERDAVLFISQAQPPLDKGYIFSRQILEFSASLKIKEVFTFAAMPQPIDHNQDPRVWVVASHTAVLKDIQKLGGEILNEGQISGLNGLLLGVAKEMGMRGACLLGEIPFYTIQIENPRATLKVLDTLRRYLNLDIDFSLLIQRSNYIKEEIDKLISYLKGEASFPEQTPLSEEDIQRIKIELNKYSKLPQSVRAKIEDLFRQAEKDISFASELKKLLDSWNVYAEYEDRFLDLFRKKRLDH